MIRFGMSKSFRAWDIDQKWLLPPSFDDLVPPGHLAYFVRDTVREVLDLSAILSAYGEERGQPPYHPAMMVALLLYGYSRGVYSSRRLSQACEERLDFMAVTGLNRPDFRTISDFRKRHLAALSDLFVQVLRLCRAAGLVRLGHVAIDGTKLKANASRHKAMSYARMKAAEIKLEAEVARWMTEAERADEWENATTGTGRRGDEVPAWLADKAQRLARIRAARAALEKEAAGGGLAPDGPGPSTGMQRLSQPCRGADGGPPDGAQRNFTDPDSRILPTRDAFIAGYNAQIAVDASHQVIVSHRLITNSTDVDGLVPLVDATYRALGRLPAEVSADTGFASEANLAAMEERQIRAYVPGRRGRSGEPPENTAKRLKRNPRIVAMEAKLRRAGRRSRYRLRKQVVEPVFGQIKEARGFRQFLLRGLTKVRSEWALLCTVHNLLKLAAVR